jgi:hypothetical protein
MTDVSRGKGRSSPIGGELRFCGLEGVEPSRTVVQRILSPQGHLSADSPALWAASCGHRSGG